MTRACPTASGARVALGSVLADAVRGDISPNQVSAHLDRWPKAIAIVALRTSLHDLATALVMCREKPSRTLSKLILESVEQIPVSPVSGRLGAVADYASCRFFESLGLGLAIPVRTVDLVLPGPWRDLGQWAADFSPIAVRGFSGDLACALSRREPDLLRGAVLAALQGRVLTCSRILRWTSFRHPPATTVLELVRYLEARPDEGAGTAFQVAVLRTCLLS